MLFNPRNSKTLLKIQKLGRRGSSIKRAAYSELRTRHIYYLDMKVVFVHPYPCSIKEIGADQLSLNRERIILKSLLDKDVSISAYGFLSDSKSVISSGDELNWKYLPIKYSASSEILPMDTIEPIIDSCADVLIVKGCGTVLGKPLSKIFGTVVLILGGKHLSDDLHLASVIMTENERQQRHCLKFLPRKNVIQLPKYVPDLFFGLRKQDPAYDIAVVSNFFAWKNHKALMPLRDSPVHLAFIGSGPLLNGFKESFEDHLATADFYGSVEPRTVAEVLLNSKVLVHPSKSEGFPRAAAEALSAGAPVVALKSVVREPVRHLWNGLLVNDGKLCSEALKLLGDPIRLSSYSANARADAREIFNEDCVLEAAAKLQSSLEECVSFGRPKSSIRHNFWKAVFSHAATTRGSLSKVIEFPLIHRIRKIFGGP